MPHKKNYKNNLKIYFSIFYTLKFQIIFRKTHNLNVKLMLTKDGCM